MVSPGAVVSAAQLSGELLQVRLIADGQDIRRVTVANLHKLQAHYGRACSTIDGAVPLFIERNIFQNAFTEGKLALGTGDIGSLMMEVTVGTLSAVATLRVFAKETAALRPFGTHVRILTHAMDFPATGENENNNLPVYGRNPGVGYLAVHIPDASGYLLAGDVGVELNTVPIIERVPGDLMAQIIREDGRVPIASVVTIPFDLPTTENSFLGMGGAGDFRLKLNTVGGALGNAVSVIAETIHGLPQPAQA